MNFVLWLVRRAQRFIIGRWNQPEDKDHFSGKVELALLCVTGSWLGVMGYGLLIMDGPIFLVSFVTGATAYTTLLVLVDYLVPLHAQYRTEQPEQEKLKRKRSLNERVNVQGDDIPLHVFDFGEDSLLDSHGCIGDYFEEEEMDV